MDLEPDDIGADIMKAMAGDSPAVAEVETDILPANTQEDAVDPPVIEGATEGRVRDEHGRFAKADETVQSAPAQAAEPAQQQSTILPPKSWTPAAKAQFASLAPEVQQEILRREGEIDAGKQQWDTKAERFNKLDAALAPHRERLNLAGVADEVYISRLAQADKLLTENFAQGILEVGRLYGVDLRQMFTGGSQPQADPQQAFQPQQPQFDPARFKAELKQEMEQEAARAAVARQIEEFSSDPAHIYFDNVRAEMTALLSSGAAKDLKQAYTMACNARDDIRQLMAAGALTKAPTTPTRPAGPQVTGAQKGVSKPNGALHTSSIEDDVRAAMEEVSGAV